MSKAKVSASDPNPVTQPRPVDAAGRELDQWGLPLNGPARARALAEAGKPDPDMQSDAWAFASDEVGAQSAAPAVPQAKEVPVKESGNG